MRRALFVIASVALVSAVVYLVAINLTQTEFRFTQAMVITFPLGGIVVGAFLLGAVAVLGLVGIQSGRRALSSWRQTRQRRRREQFEAWQERGDALMWAGDPRQARVLLEKALRRRPDDPEAVLALAESYRATGEVRRALDLLSAAAIKYHSTRPQVLLALAEVQRTAGERGAQLETLERVRALHPRAPQVLAILRAAYCDAGRWPEAVSAQEVLIAETTDGAQLLREQERMLALRYQAALQIGDARDRAQALTALTERRLAPLPVAVSLGDAQLTAGDADQAWDTWERALRATPRTVLVERLIQLAAEPRRQDRLTQVLGKLRPDDTHMAAVHLFAARIHLIAGRITEASRELDGATGSDVAGAVAKRLRAEVLHKRGMAEQALQLYAECNQAGEGVEHRCRTCGRASDGWVGYCPSCNSWDSYRSTIEIGRN